MRWGAAVAVATILAVVSGRFAEAEFQVNGDAAGPQWSPTIGSDADGNFVVAWESGDWHGTSVEPDGDASGVFARRFGADGTALGGDFQVNAYTTGAQRSPSIAVGSDGSFVLVWSSEQQDGSGSGVFGRRYDPVGNAVGGEFQVNSYTTGDQRGPRVRMAADGSFAVVWQSDGQDGDGFGVFTRRFGADGVPLGSEVQVNTVTTGQQEQPAVETAPSGDFVVVWTDRGSGSIVKGRHFDAVGAPLGSEFVVLPFGAWPEIARFSDGSFVATWRGQFQRFDASGTLLGTETSVTTQPIGSFPMPVSVAPDDSMLVAWTRQAGTVGDIDTVAVRAYDAAGAPTSVQFDVPTYEPQAQFHSGLAPGRDGFLVVWGAAGGDCDPRGAYVLRCPDQDGDLAGIFAERLIGTFIDRPVSASRIALKRTSSRERFSLLIRDPLFPFPPLTSGDNPTSGVPGGLTIELLSPTEGAVALEVPGGAGWTQRDVPVADVHKFINRLAPAGPSFARRVVLKRRKVAKVAGRDTGLPMATSHGSLVVRLTMGHRRACAIFDAATVTIDVPGSFLARNAPVPVIADCSDETLGF